MCALVENAGDFSETVVCESFLGRFFWRGLLLRVVGVFFPDSAAVIYSIPASTEGVVEARFCGVYEGLVAGYLMAADECQGEPPKTIAPAVPAPGIGVKIWRVGFEPGFQ